MRSTPEIDRLLRERLAQAVAEKDAGSADAFGRRIGYTNGGYIREVLGKKQKPVRESMIDRVHAAPGLEGWFDAVLTEHAQPLRPDQLEQKLLSAWRALGEQARAQVVGYAEALGAGAPATGLASDMSVRTDTGHGGLRLTSFQKSAKARLPHKTTGDM